MALEAEWQQKAVEISSTEDVQKVENAYLLNQIQRKSSKSLKFCRFMVKFRQLFSFKKKEIDAAFQLSERKSSILGLKLLTSPIPKKNLVKEEVTPDTHGKILIITPRASGKAHERNLLRRRIKSIYFEEELYKKPVTSILLVYKEAKELGFDELKDFLVRNLK